MISPQVDVRLVPAERDELARRAGRRGRFHAGKPNVSSEIQRAVAWYLATCPDFYDPRLGHNPEVEQRADGSIRIRVLELSPAVG